jgi:hypothetical protein
MSGSMPFVGCVAQIDIEYKDPGLRAVLVIVQSVNHDTDTVRACSIIPSKDESTSAWYDIPISEIEIIGSAFWAPEEIKN